MKFENQNKGKPATKNRTFSLSFFFLREKKNRPSFFLLLFLHCPAMAVDPNFHVNPQSSETIINSEWPIEKVVRFLEENGFNSITHTFKGIIVLHIYE